MGSEIRDHEGGADEKYLEYSLSPTDSPSIATVMAVADRTDRPLDELSPLHDVIDPDAVDALLRDSSTEACITFEYEGCIVRLDRGLIQVSPHENDSSGK